MTLESLDTLDHVRQSFNAVTSRTDRSEIGQFLTPVSIADFMSSLFEATTNEIRLLDPGAGAGVLFAACVKKFLSQKKLPASIEVIAYETDKIILPYLKKTMNKCSELCKEKKVPFTGIIREDDFISSAISETEESLFPVRLTDSLMLFSIRLTKRSMVKQTQKPCSIRQAWKWQIFTPLSCGCPCAYLNRRGR
jgi:hypothetical protein